MEHKDEVLKQDLQEKVMNALQNAGLGDEIMTESEMDGTEGGGNTGICINFRKGCGGSNQQETANRNADESVNSL